MEDFEIVSIERLKVIYKRSGSILDVLEELKGYSKGKLGDFCITDEDEGGRFILYVVNDGDEVCRL